MKPCKDGKFHHDSEPMKSTSKHRRFSRHRVKHDKPEAKDATDIKQTQSETVKTEAEIDFGATILNADVSGTFVLENIDLLIIIHFIFPLVIVTKITR